MVLVSSRYHGYRAVRLFKPLFRTVAFEAAPDTAIWTCWGSMREVAGVLKMWWEGTPRRDPQGQAGAER